MTLVEFYELQYELMRIFGWFLRWWLIAFLVGGVFAGLYAWMLVVAREMIDKL